MSDFHTSHQHYDILGRLIEMQKLNDDIQALTQQLKNTLKQIQKLQDKHAKLDEFYQKECQSLCTAYQNGSISEQDLDYVNKKAQTKGYSILSEDGIWNVLIDAEQTQVALIKQLVRSL
ncbi:DUF4298 domain-containing protein [Moraxella catarrhalis]|uniref:DUF4298 domain-containing protein n=1 Tax=Moraxella catarrhalis TaxID=480 RepID=UPI0007E30784|nr:DUF4298 domain-containing protein [Moraxella catarrhalis]RKM20859.1 DUF4298 domain-containing protein [Moraxella catarrhalis]